MKSAVGHGDAARRAAAAGAATSTTSSERSRDRSDFDLDQLVALGRVGHAQTDAPWVKTIERLTRRQLPCDHIQCLGRWSCRLKS